MLTDIAEPQLLTTERAGRAVAVHLHVPDHNHIVMAVRAVLFNENFVRFIENLFLVLSQPLEPAFVLLLHNLGDGVANLIGDIFLIIAISLLTKENECAVSHIRQFLNQIAHGFLRCHRGGIHAVQSPAHF